MNCSVCDGDTGRDFAMVGVDERLCMVNGEKSAGCFAWFSGYPWVLFEMGALVSVIIYYPWHGSERWVSDAS